VGRFAVVFGLIWLVWINGAVYHDLHGRAEGRTRAYDFFQMGVLALLAVFTGEATARDGPAFAVVYSAYLIMLGWLWHSVRRQTTRPSVPRGRVHRRRPRIGHGRRGERTAAGWGAPGPWALVVVSSLAGITVLDWRSNQVPSRSAHRDRRDGRQGLRILLRSI
jgi:hypothetical protein